MKYLKFLLFCAASVFGMSAYGQSTQLDRGSLEIAPATRLEALESRSGTVIVKSFSEIGVTHGVGGSLIVAAVDVLDTADNKREHGLMLQLLRTGSDPRETRAYVDYDEIDSLLQSAEDISKITENTTRLPIFRARYTTRDSVSLIVFNRPNGEISAEVELGHGVRESAFFTLNDFAKIRQIFVNAKVKLDSVRK
jgi:hypothetical protein